MSSLGLPVSRLINVSVNVSPAGASFQNFNTALIVGTSTVCDLTQRLRTYTSLTQVATDFGTSAPEYLAASLWFGQSPAPVTLVIGRWANAAAAGQLIGGLVTATNQLIATWNAITTGSFEVALNGVPTNITGLNFSANGNLNAVASTIATALNAASAGTTCVWNSVYSNFIITSGTTGAASSVSLLNTTTAIGSITFTGLPANNDTVTVNGVVITFVTSGATGNQINIAGSATLQAAALQAFLAASSNPLLTVMSYTNPTSAPTIVYCASIAGGTTGNTYTLAKTSTNITVSGATLAGGGVGTDISSIMAGKTANGAYTAAGQVAETALAAVTLMDTTYPGYWYGLVVLGAADTDHTAIAGYVEAASTARHYYGVTTQEAGVLTATSTTDIAYLLAQLKYNHTACQYSSTNPYAIVSYLARILTTNWTGTNTTITLMYKQEPGVTPETLTSSQINALEGKNCNVYVNYNTGVPIIEQGMSVSGLWTDLIIGLDWFANYAQIEVFNLLFGANKIPQTDPGMNQIATVLTSACQQAVQNGLVAPGIWNATGFGNLSQGEALSKGYYVYQPPISSQSQTNRQARQSVPFQIALKQAGAVHDVAVTVNVNQ